MEIRRALARAAWLAVFIGHLSPTAQSLLGDRADFLRGLILLACQALFLLKALDAPFLRLPATPRARWAAAVIVLVMHGRVLATSAGFDVNDLSAVAVETISISALAAVFLPRRSTLRNGPAARTHVHLGLWQQRTLGALRPRFELLFRSLSLQRPPPHCA